MRTAGQYLAFVLATVLPAATQSTPPAAPVNPPATLPSPPATDAATKPGTEAPAKLSPQVAQMLSDQLPKFTPPAPPKPEPAPNPDLLVLPKMTVTQKKRPRLGDQVMMTSPAFNDKLAKEMMSAFDRGFLNKYDWLGPYSAAERAREEYDYQKKEELKADVFNLARVVEQEDPAKAKALRDAVSKP